MQFVCRVLEWRFDPGSWLSPSVAWVVSEARLVRADCFALAWCNSSGCSPFSPSEVVRGVQWGGVEQVFEVGQFLDESTSVGTHPLPSAARPAS